MIAGTCDENSAIAFVGKNDGENINCVDSFNYPTFLPIDNDDKDAVNIYKGF
jgi:hypothetical protein